MPQGKIGGVQEVIEQHVEKGVLGLCVILLFVAIGRWVFSSPRAVDVYTGNRIEDVAPDDVDDRLLAAARMVKDRADQEPATRPPNPDFLSLVRARRGMPFKVNVSSFIALSPPPQLRPRDQGRRRYTVQELQEDMRSLSPGGSPPAPDVWAGRVLYQQDGRTSDGAVAHIVASFPLAELHEEWDERLQEASTSIRIVVAGMIVESRSRLSGGPWMANEAELHHSYEGQPPEVLAYDGSNSIAVLQSVRAIKADWQEQLLRPDYWQVYDPDAGQWASWTAAFADGIDTEDPNLLWAHDVSLKPMQEYQYRYRLVLVNPLLAAEDDVQPELAEQARQRFIETDWSDWSQEVSVPSSTEFFISGSSASDRSVDITVFSLARHVAAKFTVSPGQVIGGRREVVVTDTNGQHNEIVDFSTGAVLVWIDFNKTVYQGTTPFRDNTEILYLDAQGNLHTRLSNLDKRALNSLTGR